MLETGIGQSLSEFNSTPNILRRDTGLRFGDAVAAIIVTDDGRYLMQLRDDKPGIFYPGHWGFFGGGVDSGEDEETALRRELFEELNFIPDKIRFFTRMNFDLHQFGFGNCYRVFYEMRITLEELDRFTLGEGSGMESIGIAALLMERRLVPYDSFALWMHYYFGNCSVLNGRPGFQY